MDSVRYIIIEKENGIFLGNYLDIPLFSNVLLFPIIKAYSFETLEEAKEYVEYISYIGIEFCVKKIACKQKYIPIDILIKAGYSEYTKRMLKYTPVTSQTVH